MSSLLVKTGDARTFQIIIKDEDESVVDVTNWTFKLALAKYHGATPELSVNGTITDAAAGTVQFELSKTQTENLDTGVYYYEVQATTDLSKPYTVDRGKITIEEDIAT